MNLRFILTVLCVFFVFHSCAHVSASYYLTCQEMAPFEMLIHRRLVYISWSDKVYVSWSDKKTTRDVLVELENVTVPPLTLPCTNQLTVCGRPAVQPASTRVVGGREALAGSWPWTVALVELGAFQCGGAVIHQSLILTAAHCVSGNSSDPSRWQVMAGKHNLERVEPGQTAVKVKQIILHEGYNNLTLANDIALLVLSEALTFSTTIQPICIPATEQATSAGEMGLMAGWGETMGTGNRNVLNQVALPIISDDVCGLPDWYWTDFIPQTTFCAGYEAGGKDSCKGDSGGPLICKRSDSWFIQGISSWGFQCAEYRWPGIYTNVSKYINWITSTVTFDLACGNVVG